MQYLKLSKAPTELLIKVKRFLDYSFESKREVKIEESEVFDLLNDDLRSTLTLYSNGRILKTVSVFTKFPLEFLGHLTFVLKKRSFHLEEYIFWENDEEHELFFITSGMVSLIHRASYSFITSLNKDQAFGEIGFFTDARRQLSCKSSDYTETMCLQLTDFLNTAGSYSLESIVSAHIH